MQVANLQVYDTLMNAAKCRSDKTMMMRIHGEDFVAMEAKCHRACYRRYRAAASSSKSTARDKSIKAEYESAFLKLINKIEQKLVKEARTYGMGTLSGMYKLHLTDPGMEKAVVDMYKVQSLKRRLIQHYGRKLQFHQQYERNKSELVCSSSLNLSEIISFVAELTKATKDCQNALAAADTCAQVLYHAAIILRSEMKGATGIETQLLNVSDISIQKATKVVLVRLQQFLR